MAFTKDDQIMKRLAGLLKQTVDGMEEYWGTIVTDSRTAAYNEILSRLLARGFTPAQIASWDRGPEFEKDIALYWCLVKGEAAPTERPDDTLLEKLDRRDDLDDVLVTVGGILIDPAADSGNVIGFGYVDETADEFKYGIGTEDRSGQGMKSGNDQRSKW